ncbi:hypothetical protein ACFL0R_01205 [Pseudomonadota bacterium]
MKPFFKFLAVLTFGLIAINLVSIGVLVIGMAAGAESAIWGFWYVVLFSTLATVIAATAAAIVFLIEFGRDRYQRLSSAVSRKMQAHRMPIHEVLHG